MPVQTTDIHKTMPGDYGISLAGQTSFWVIAAGVIVSSDLGIGAYGSQDNTTLINDGTIASGSGSSQAYLPAVLFDANGGQIINAEDGTIMGYDGVQMDGHEITTTNFGSILCEGGGVTFLGASQDALLDNYGTIYSDRFGAIDVSNSGGNTVINSGIIEGRISGLAAGSVAKVTTHVVNSGVIRGGPNAILGLGNGALDLHNSGKLIGQVSLQTVANDVLVNTGSISGAVHLGGGDDSFVGTGGTSGAVFGEDGVDKITGGSGADTLHGGADSDTLIGGLGADRLYGGDGTDILKGGTGVDTLSGGAGNDKFVFDIAPGPANRDMISDFVHGHDKFQLDNAVFNALGANGPLNPARFWAGPAAHDANDNVIYNRATGALFYDSDGTGSHNAIQFATLVTKPPLTAGDFAVI